MNPETENMSLSDKVCPERSSSIMSRLTFFWFTKLVWKGWFHTLKMKDIWRLDEPNTVSHIVWRWKDIERTHDNKKEKSTLKMLIKQFGLLYALSSLLVLISTVLQFASPQIVDMLIDFVDNKNNLGTNGTETAALFSAVGPDQIHQEWHGYVYIGLICITVFGGTMLNSQAFYLHYLVGMRIKTALTTVIYQKSLKLSNASRQAMTAGETVNLMSVDTQRIQDLILYLNFAWSAPLQILLAIYFLYQILGVSALAGLAVMVLLIPINAFVVAKMKIYQQKQMTEKDKRTRLMDEVLNGVKVIKLYNWELSFFNKIKKIRDSEIDFLKKNAYLSAFTTFLWTCAPVMVALVSFTCYIFTDPVNHILDAKTAFVSLTLFNMLRIPFNILPMILTQLVQCQISLRRINIFLNCEELDPQAVDRTSKDPKFDVKVEGGVFSWNRVELDGRVALRNVNMEVQPGKLVAVIGSVGAGKSSLLQALLGQMRKLGGSVKMAEGKRVAYVSQDAWIQNATLKDNIIFKSLSGEKQNVDEEHYKRVKTACALDADLEILANGDKTEIGEKGINLSGGQKQRVSLARAVYSKSDIYMLDDPLSAVDSHVANHIFQEVIGPEGVLKHTTRILVTNSIKFLNQVDKIVAMKNGKIEQVGTYEDLVESNVIQDIIPPENEDENDGGDTTDGDITTHMETTTNTLREMRTVQSTEEENRQRVLSESDMIPPSDEIATNINENNDNKLIGDEHVEIGHVKWSIYRGFIQKVGYVYSTVTILAFLIYQGFQVVGNVWLSVWSTDEEAQYVESTRDYYIIIYAVFGIFQSVFVMVGTSLLMLGTLEAAKTMHNGMMQRILRAPMHFFDVTPLGRILNRFSKDVDTVDVTIPMNIRMLLTQLMSVFGTFIVLCYSSPIFIIALIPIGLIYFFIQHVYVTTARQVKRLESISRSPIYSHFGETLNGSTTIRAFDKSESFERENERRVDINQATFFLSFISSRWLTVRVEIVGNVVIVISALISVILRDSMDPGLVGLSLSYSLNLTMVMNMLVRMTSEVETNMVSVERIQEYESVEVEEPNLIYYSQLPKSWPKSGRINFNKYGAKYRTRNELVLKSIDARIDGGEKIGIVGRTGAGKSSITLSLFRMIEQVGGSIEIDGINIARLSLNQLRSKITIIPQDPILFSGSLRTNMDPFQQFGDDEIWNCLEQASLKSYVSSLPDTLSHEIVEGGQNLSIGQRQLVCLARAMLRHTKVLILDEATAAIDVQTDDLIQQSIRKHFKDCTVLTIAHRINTIMDNTRILVLDDGRVAEFDTPELLLRNKNSIFYSMASAAGLVN